MSLGGTGLPVSVNLNYSTLRLARLPKPEALGKGRLAPGWSVGWERNLDVSGLVKQNNCDGVAVDGFCAPYCDSTPVGGMSGLPSSGGGAGNPSCSSAPSQTTAGPSSGQLKGEPRPGGNCSSCHGRGSYGFFGNVGNPPPPPSAECGPGGSGGSYSSVFVGTPPASAGCVARPPAGEPDTISMTTEDGDIVYFLRRGASEQWYPAPDKISYDKAPILLERAGTGWELVDVKSGNRSLFDSDGHVVGERDRSGNSMSIRWASAAGSGIRTLTNDITGQALELVYANVTVGAETFFRLSEVRDKSSNGPANERRSYTLAYDTTGNLKSIVDAGGFATTYTYDAAGYMTSKTDADMQPGAPTEGPANREVRYSYEPAPARTGMVRRLVDERVCSKGDASCTVPFSSVQVAYPDAPGKAFELTRRGRLSPSVAGPAFVERMVFDGLGNLVKELNTNSSTAAVTIERDTDTFLPVRITDQSGAITELAYDKYAQLTSVTEDAGRTGSKATTFIEYGGPFRHLPTKVTDPEGRVRTYRLRAADGVVEGITDLGKDNTPEVTSYEVDLQGRVTATILPDGKRVTQTYDALGFPAVRAFDPAGLNLVASERADWRGWVAERTDVNGARSTFAYDLKGRLTAVVSDTAGSAKRATVSYTPTGDIIQVTDAVGTPMALTRRFSYGDLSSGGARLLTTASDLDASGRVLRTRKLSNEVDGTVRTDQLLATTTTNTTFNADGSSVERRARSRGAVVLTARDPRGLVTSVTDGTGRIVVATQYDAFGRPSQTTQGPGAANLVTTYAYDKSGLPTVVTDSGGKVVRNQYDSHGRLVRVEEGDGGTVLSYRQYTYAGTGAVGFGRGFVVQEARGGATPDPTVAMTYDSLGRVTSRTVDPSGKALRTEYEYGTAQGGDRMHVSRMREPNQVAGLAGSGAWTTYSYDRLGRLLRVVDAAGGQFDYEYDVKGNLVRQTGAGRAQTFAYDALGRKIASEQGGRTERWVYRADDSAAFYCPFAASSGACNATNPGSWRYRYDASQALLLGIDYPEVAGIPSADATYAYDASDRVSKVTDVKGTTDYTYDVIGRLLQRTRTPVGRAAKTITYSYKPQAQGLARMDYWGQGSVAMTTDALGRMTQLTDWNGGARTYGYDGARIVSVSGAKQAQYAYDSAGRLESKSIRNAAGSPMVAFSQRSPGAERDANGNILGITEAWLNEAPVAHQFDYDALNRVTRIRHGALAAGPWGAGAAAIDVTNQYDGAGNATVFMGRAMEYDLSDRVKTFSYDANGSVTVARFAQENGLLGRWKGEGSVADTAGTNDGSWVGPPSYAPGRSGLAFAVNGSSTVVIPDQPAMNTARFALDFSVNLQSAPVAGTWYDIVTKSQASPLALQFAVLIDTRGRLNAWLYSASNTLVAKAISASGLTLNAWDRVTVTCDGTTLRLFRNGALEASAILSGPMGFAAVPMRVGKNRSAGATVALVDELRFYNTADPSVATLGFWDGDNAGKDADGVSDGEPANMTYAPGQAGTAFSLSESSASSVTIPSVAAYQGQSFTVDTRVFITAVRAGQTQSLVSKGTVPSSSLQFWLGIDFSGKFMAYVYSGNVGYPVWANPQVALNRWTRLTMTSDGSSLKLYVDGALQMAAAIPGPINVGPAPLVIGKNWQPSVTGLVDEVKFLGGAIVP